MCTQCRNPMHLSRRGLLAGAAALLAAGTLPRPGLAESVPAAAPNAIAPDEALRRIMDGNARYVSGALASRDYAAGRAALAAVQYPIASILSCADSRVAPEIAFDQSPGELFVVRVAGNFVNDDGLASLEYGARFLGVPLVMVLGHSNCGAVSAGIKVVKENLQLPGHLPALVGSIKPAVEAAMSRKPADLLQEATAENVRLNVKRLSESNPILSEMVRQEKLRIVGGVYDIGTGAVSLV